MYLPYCRRNEAFLQRLEPQTRNGQPNQNQPQQNQQNQGQYAQNGENGANASADNYGDYAFDDEQDEEYQQ